MHRVVVRHGTVTGVTDFHATGLGFYSWRKPEIFIPKFHIHRSKYELTCSAPYMLMRLIQITKINNYF